MMPRTGVCGSKQNYHADWQGSVVAMSSASGALLESYSYSAFGEVADASGNPFRYTGRRIDPASREAWPRWGRVSPEKGLYSYRARYYAPKIGRFLQTDPVGYDAGLHLYAYVGNDPANNNDPGGKNPLALAGACALSPVCRGIVGAVGGAVVSGAVEVRRQIKSGQGFNASRIGVAIFSGSVQGFALARGANPFIVGGATAAASSVANDVFNGNISDAGSAFDSGVNALFNGAAGSLGGAFGSKIGSMLGIKAFGLGLDLTEDFGKAAAGAGLTQLSLGASSERIAAGTLNRFAVGPAKNAFGAGAETILDPLFGAGPASLRRSLELGQGTQKGETFSCKENPDICLGK